MCNQYGAHLCLLPKVSPVTFELLFQLLEAVQSVHKAVKSNNRDEQEPPLPPYPDLANLRLDQGRSNDSLAKPSLSVVCCVRSEVLLMSLWQHPRWLQSNLNIPIPLTLLLRKNMSLAMTN